MRWPPRGQGLACGRSSCPWIRIRADFSCSTLPRPPLLAVVHEVDPPRYFFIGQDTADLHFHPEGLPLGWTRAVRWAHFGSLGLVREPLAGRLLHFDALSMRFRETRLSPDPDCPVCAPGRAFPGYQALQALCLAPSGGHET